MTEKTGLQLAGDEVPGFSLSTAQVARGLVDPGLTHESSQELPENLITLRGLASAEGKDAFARVWEEELQGDSEMQHIARLEGRVQVLDAESLAASDAILENKNRDTAHRIRADELRLFGAEKVQRYTELKYMQKRLKDDGRLTLSDENASRLAKFFLDPKYLHSASPDIFIAGMASLVPGNMDVRLEMPSNDSVFDIPVNSIVSASGFTSWDGAGNDASKKKIADYASRDTPIPKINELYAFILPDGKTVFETANAHRVAAARLKGDTSISFNGTLFVTELWYTPYPLRR